MASSQISAFVIVLVLAGVQSAIKDLGEDCTAPTDTCVHPTLALICDTPAASGSGKCRVQADQACNDAGGLCVNGATCVTNVCTCGSGYTKAADKKCTPPAVGWGLACSAAGDCTKAGLTCTSPLCVCDAATKAYVLTDGTCADIATNKVGFACTDTDKTTTCGASATTHLTCSSTTATAGVCQCDPGYFPKKSGDDCVQNTNSKIGLTCVSGGSECGTTATTFLECPAALKCACKAGYIGYPGGVCFPAKGTLKGGCAADADCTGVSGLCTQLTGVPKTCKTALAAGAACTTDTAGTVCGAGLTCDTTCKTLVGAGGDCTSTSTTKCNTGMTCTSGKCVIDAGLTGGSCTVTSAPAFSTGSCTSTNAVCGATTSGICVCPTGYSGEPASNCVIIAKMFGGSCTTATANTKGDCNDVSLVCSATSSGTCACATGYGGGVNGLTCYADKSLGGGCSASSVCSDSNAECTTSKCTCKTDYVASNGKCVLKAGTLSAGASCSGKTCVDGSTCSTTTNKCTCNTGYTESTDGYCRAADNLNGGPCTVTAAKPAPVGTCTDANSNCVNGICKCKGTYIGNLGETCRLSGAGTITLSISLLMLQLAACVWQAFPA